MYNEIYRLIQKNNIKELPNEISNLTKLKNM